jgi:hypothetical protein
MDIIFRAHLAGRQTGLSAEEIAEEKEMARMAAASVRHEMGEAEPDHAGSKRMRIDAELDDAAHDEREAAIDAEVESQEQRKNKRRKKKNKGAKRPVKGTVPQAMWEDEELNAANRVLQNRISPDKSERGKMFKCVEWRQGQQQYVQFYGIAYSFQTLAYFASHPDDVLQQSMSVHAYPCENKLCISPEHLFLRVEAKRGRLNTNLPPLDDRGTQCAHRSQQKMLQLKDELKPVGAVLDPYLTEPISLFDYSKMGHVEQERFQRKSVYTKK